MPKTIQLSQLNGDWTVNNATGTSRIWSRGDYSIVYSSNVFGSGDTGWIIKQTNGVDILALKTTGQPWDSNVTIVWNPNATGYSDSISSSLQLSKSLNDYLVQGAGNNAVNGLYGIYDSTPTFNNNAVYTNGTYYIFYQSTYQQWVISSALEQTSSYYLYKVTFDGNVGTVVNGTSPAPTAVIYSPYMNLTAANIKNGIVISNITGTFTSDANASSSDMLSGKTAYVNGSKVTGNIQTVTATVSENTVTVPKGYIASAQTITIQQESSGVQTDDATATVDDILSGKTAYISTGKVEGTIQTVNVTVSGNTVTVPKGYHSSSSTYSCGSIKAATIYVPGTADQTISANQFLSGAQTIKGDANLVASNIKNGVTLFSGTATSISGTFTSDSNAVDSDILSGKTAYVQGSKITGSLTISASDIKAGSTVGGVTGTFTNDANATASNILSGKTAYVNGSKVTGNIQTITATVSGNTVTVPKGYHSSSSTYSCGSIKSAASYVPGTSDQTISANQFLSGVQTIKGDANLVASNIKSGVTIFGVTGTASGGGGSERIYPLYMANGWRDNPERLMQADINISGSTITFPTPFRQSTYGSTGLIFNGNLYRHNSSLNNDSWNKSFPISTTGDWDFITRNPNGDNLVAIKGGKLALVHASDNSNPFYSGSDPVSIVIPTNSPLGITQLARGYDCWYCIDENGHPSVFQESTNSTWGIVTRNDITISKILNQYISDWNEGEPFHGCLAIDTNGSILKLNTDWWDNFGEEGQEFAVDTYASAGNDPFLNMFYYSESTMDYFYAYCVNFAIRSSGLWYKIGDGSWNQLSNAPSLLSGNMLGYAFSALREDGYNEETWEPIYSLDIQKVALHIDSSGRLWKLMANMDLNGSFTGIGVTQIGSDTDWTYVNPVYGKNQSSIAQKGGKLYVLKSSNDNNFTFTWTEYYMNPPGKLIMQNQEGLWFAPNGSNYNVIYSEGVINSQN